MAASPAERPQRQARLSPRSARTWTSAAGSAALLQTQVAAGREQPAAPAAPAQFRSPPRNSCWPGPGGLGNGQADQYSRTSAVVRPRPHCRIRADSPRRLPFACGDLTTLLSVARRGGGGVRGRAPQGAPRRSAHQWSAAAVLEQDTGDRHRQADRRVGPGSTGQGSAGAVSEATVPPGFRQVIVTDEGITVYPARFAGDRWRAVWYEPDGTRRQCQAVTEERLAARLDPVIERLAADAPNMLRTGAELIAYYLSAERLPIGRQWSREHADTQRDLCARHLEPVIGALDLPGHQGGRTCRR